MRMGINVGSYMGLSQKVVQKIAQKLKINLACITLRDYPRLINALKAEYKIACEQAQHPEDIFNIFQARVIAVANDNHTEIGQVLRDYRTKEGNGIHVQICIRALRTFDGGPWIHIPEVEAALDDDTANLIKKIAKKKNVDTYRSIIDFMACNLISGLESRCQKFYKGDGPSFEALATDEQIAYLRRTLLGAIKVAKDGQYSSWKAYKEAVEKNLND